MCMELSKEKWLEAEGIMQIACRYILLLLYNSSVSLLKHFVVRMADES